MSVRHQLEQQEDALKYYERAASMSDSELTAPRFLLSRNYSN